MVLIAIVTRNRSETLKDTLKYLDSELIRKMLVVDGSEEDKTKEICKNYPLEYLRQQSTGMTSARNEALEHCDSEYIVFIDDDVRVSGTWYDAICEAFEEEGVVGVTGKLEDESLELGGFARKVRDFLFGGRESFGEIKDNGVINGDFFYDERKVADHMPGCNMAYHVPTLEEAGGFDEDIDVGNSYREDTIASYRVSRKGKIVYKPEASVDHLAVEEDGDRKKWLFYNPYLTRYFLESEDVISGVKNWFSHGLVSATRHAFFLVQSLKNLKTDYLYYLYGDLRGCLDFHLLGRKPREHF